MGVPQAPPAHTGLWQNAVQGAGDMMVAATEFQAMRYGLGVTLMTDGYFSNSPVGGSFYGAPTYYTEYEADLGFPKSAARLLLNGTGHGEVWTRYSFSAFYPQIPLDLWSFIFKNAFN
jgi:hypothetical protein